MEELGAPAGRPILARRLATGIQSLCFLVGCVVCVVESVGGFGKARALLATHPITAHSPHAGVSHLLVLVLLHFSFPSTD